jgi:hypothetical protein
MFGPHCDFEVSLLGGCSDTDHRHIRALAKLLSAKPFRPLCLPWGQQIQLHRSHPHVTSQVRPDCGDGDDDDNPNCGAYNFPNHCITSLNNFYTGHMPDAARTCRTTFSTISTAPSIEDCAMSDSPMRPSNSSPKSFGSQPTTTTRARTAPMENAS